MDKGKKFVVILSLFVLVAVLTACGGDKEIYGKITKVSDTEITIETGTYEEPSKPSEKATDSSSSNGSSKAESTDSSTAKATTSASDSSSNSSGKSSNSKSETPPAKPDGDDSKAGSGEKPSGDPPSGDKGNTPKDMGGFTSDGGSATYTLSSNVDVSDLNEGDLIKLTLDGDTVTAIESVQQPGDGQPPNGKSDSTTDTTSDTGTTELTATYTVDGTTKSSADKDYESKTENVSSVLVANKGNLTLKGGTLSKSRDTTSDDESNFYGLNAIFVAAGGSTATIDGTTFSSSSSGSNAIFSTGAGSKITAKNFKIYTTGNSARGLDATYGGSIVASDGDITTKGAHCAPIATDRGEGTVKVSNTSVSAEGDGSPCIYSTGKITAEKLTGSATGSQIAVVEGKNSITMKNCTLQGAGDNGIMLYQSTSGDAAKGQATFKAIDSKLTTTTDGPMFYVTNTKASATLENTDLYFDNDVLARVSGNNTNNWGKEGENGGNFTLTGVSQALKGSITCDKISTVALKLTKSTDFTGAINTKNTAKSAAISLDKTSTWTLTADSYVSAITNKDTKFTNIRSSGHTVYYDKDNEANGWLKGKTLSLSGGGKLTPES